MARQLSQCRGRLAGIALSGPGLHAGWISGFRFPYGAQPGAPQSRYRRGRGCAPARPQSRSATVYSVTRDRRAEIAIVSAVILLGLLAGIDAFREIPPLADDYWLLTTAPTESVRYLLTEYGAAARPLGVVVLGTLVWVVQVSDIPVPVLIGLWRFLTLALTYAIMRKALELDRATAFVALTFFLLVPPATEAWTLLCTAHQALSAPFALAACALVARAMHEPRHTPMLVLAAMTQLLTYALYEQALLMIPAFAAMCAFVAWRRRALTRQVILATGASMVIAIAWAAAMLWTGYAQRRAGDATGGAAIEASDVVGAIEASDVVGAGVALWVAFGKQFAWRLAEFVGTRDWMPWDRTAAGMIAVVASMLLVVVVGIVVTRHGNADRREPTSFVSRLPERSPLTHLVASYAALLPIGFAYPGFASFSRMYYLPGLTLAIALAIIVVRLSPVAPRRVGAVTAVTVAWLLLTWRDYLSDVRQGARMLRGVAESTVEIPASSWGEGVLVVAPDVVGTFSSAAVQSFTVRPAAKWLTGREPAGSLYFASECFREGEPQSIRDEKNRTTRVRSWGTVIVASGTNLSTSPTLRDACGGAAQRNIESALASGSAISSQH